MRSGWDTMIFEYNSFEMEMVWMNWVCGNWSCMAPNTQTPNDLIRWWAEWKNKCVCTANENITFCHCQDEISVSIDPHIHTYTAYINILMKFFQVLVDPPVRSFFFFIVCSALGVCLFWCEGLIVLPSRCILIQRQTITSMKIHSFWWADRISLACFSPEMNGNIY